MSKRIYFILFMSLGLSCAKNDGPSPQPGEGPSGMQSAKESVEIKLRAGGNEENIFGLMQFGIYADRSFSLLDLTQTYDSIVWTASGVKGRFRVLEHGDSRTRFTCEWSHHFFLPGEYETVLTGYKDHKAVSSDTVTIRISDSRDFLGYDWAEITASGKSSTGYVDVLSDRGFTTHASLRDNVPSVTLFLWDQWFSEESVPILYDYMCSLYSTPAYDSDDASLAQQYATLFTHNEADAYPLSIWITPAANVVLLKLGDGRLEPCRYEIRAEPCAAWP